MKNARFLLLLALAVMLAPHVEASRTSVWESNPPAAVFAKAGATGLLAPLAPAARLDTSAPADSEIVDSPRFDLGAVVFVESELEHEDRFDLGPLELLGPTPLRGPPPSYPETRVGGFELLPPFRVGASRSLSLWPRQACGSISCGVVSDGPEDPWGLAGDINPSSNPDVADALATARAAQQAALERERAAARKRGPTISAINGNRLRGGLYWALDTALPVGLSDERANYNPLSGAGQAAADLRAFKKDFSKEIFGAEAALALRSPGTAMKAFGLIGAFAGLQEREGTPGTSSVIRNEERLDSSGRHVIDELTRMSKEAEATVEAGTGKTAEAARYAKYKDKWFGFFFRGRAIQAEAENLLQGAASADATLGAVKIRPSLGGLIPDFVYTQGTGEQVILDITSPRSSTYQKILKYARTGEEILVEIYHEGKGFAKK